MVKEILVKNESNVDIGAGKFEMPNLTFYLPELNQSGLRQLLNEQWVTSNTDRHLIGSLLRLIADSPAVRSMIGGFAMRC